MIRLIVHGAAGRMGRMLCDAAGRDERLALLAALDIDDAPLQPGSGDAPANAIIDFSADAGARRAADMARRCGAALLVGTTALSRQTLDAIDEAARSLPVMVAPNTSRGVAVLAHVVGLAARLLGPAYQIDIIEQHHRHKLDAPSGTAVRLAGAIAASSGRELPAERLHSVRAGDIVGEHEVQFAGVAERLRFQHVAGSRELFVVGALEAMAWLVRQPPGRYTIEQSLGL